MFSALKSNIYQDIYKGQSRKNLMVLYSNSIKSHPHESSTESKIIESENRKHDKQLVSQLLEALPEKQKEVLYLRNYVNMSYKEIATVMDLSEQVVRNYGYRALQKLKAQSSLITPRKEGS